MQQQVQEQHEPQRCVLDLELDLDLELELRLRLRLQDLRRGAA